MNSPYHLILTILLRLFIAAILILGFFAVIDLMVGGTNFMPRLSGEFGSQDNAFFWLVGLFVSIFVFVLPIMKARKALEEDTT